MVLGERESGVERASIEARWRGIPETDATGQAFIDVNVNVN